VVRLSSGETCLTTAAADITVGRRVELSIRPETVGLVVRVDTDTPTSAGSIPAAVEQVAYLGGNVQYLVRSAGGLSITALASKAGARIPVGGAVDVTWSPGDALVLADHPAAQEEIPA
jgi:ABC-type Fe3+/spermidine/putrescine transport system ATPase subunit